jgi:hypothetical protein
MPVPYTFATKSGTIPLNQLDDNFSYLENAIPPFALAAGVVTTASQPNITAVGTLGSLTVTGGVTAGSITGVQLFGTIANSAQPNITEIGTLATLTVTNTLNVGTLSSTTISAVSLSGTLTTASQPNITTIGTLGSLGVTGNVTSGNVITGSLYVSGIIYSNNQINTQDIITANISASSGITGTLRTNAQPNVTSLGTLTSLNVSGNVVAGNISVSRVEGQLVTSAQPNVTSLGTLTGLTVSGTLTGNTISGTLTTASQPNITELGTLTSLSVSGNTALSGVVTAPTAANGTSNTQVATTAFVATSVASGIPTGVIVMWSGSVASIPAGWLLCNGSSGTPDLRDRFIVGAGSTYNPGNTGGSANAVVVSHTHTASSSVTDPGHAHSYVAPSGFDNGGLGGSVVDTIVSATTGTAVTGISVSTTVNSAGVSGINANLPPYYALAYIMKA